MPTPARPVSALVEPIFAPNIVRCDDASRTSRIQAGRKQMPESVYKVVELIGTSTESWEKATSAAIERAAETLRDLRVAEVVEQDVSIDNGKVESYRVKLKLSFKYEAAD
jgi:dodecin